MSFGLRRSRPADVRCAVIGTTARTAAESDVRCRGEMGRRRGSAFDRVERMSAEIWNEQVAQGYDAASAAMYAPEVLGPTVDYLARLAGQGRALELAIGTGRVAVPLAERGTSLSGIELSGPMVTELRKKIDEDSLPVVIGDMASATAAGTFTLVYAVYNAVTNLLTQDEQVGCFRNAARHLGPGGYSTTPSNRSSRWSNLGRARPRRRRRVLPRRIHLSRGAQRPASAASVTPPWPTGSSPRSSMPDYPRCWRRCRRCTWTPCRRARSRRAAAHTGASDSGRRR